MHREEPECQSAALMNHRRGSEAEREKKKAERTMVSRKDMKGRSNAAEWSLTACRCVSVCPAYLSLAYLSTPPLCAEYTHRQNFI